MTEPEWRSCNDVEELLNHLWGVFPGLEWADRKPSLLFCACGKSVQHLLPCEYRQLLAAMERGADRLAEPDDMTAALEQAERAVNPLGDEHSGLMFALDYGDLGLFGYEAARIISIKTGSDLEEMQRRIEAQYSDLVREIFGNPFRNEHIRSTATERSSACPNWRISWSRQAAGTTNSSTTAVNREHMSAAAG